MCTKTRVANEKLFLIHATEPGSFNFWNEDSQFLIRLSIVMSTDEMSTKIFQKLQKNELKKLAKELKWTYKNIMVYKDVQRSLKIKHEKHLNEFTLSTVPN